MPIYSNGKNFMSAQRSGLVFPYAGVTDVQESHKIIPSLFTRPPVYEERKMKSHMVWEHMMWDKFHYPKIIILHHKHNENFQFKKSKDSDQHW
jgi:hypothetical protein